MPFTPPKHQIPDEWLLSNANLIKQKLDPWIIKFQDKQIVAAELCVIYILLFLTHWRKNLWQSGQFSYDEIFLKDDTVLVSDLDLPFVKQNQTSLLQLLTCKRLRGVSLRAQRALIKWYKGEYPIDLTFSPPTALQLLELQAQGRRVVTLFIESHELQCKQFFRDPMTFAIHDLEHADEFFYDQTHFLLQQKFYQSILYRVKLGEFDQALQDTVFRDEFEYLIADMNSHPEHLKATFEFLWRDYKKRQNTI